MAIGDISPTRRRAVGNPELIVHRVDRAPSPGWVGWVTTTDHKRIGVLYLVTAFAFMLLGLLIVLWDAHTDPHIPEAPSLT